MIITKATGRLQQMPTRCVCLPNSPTSPHSRDPGEIGDAGAGMASSKQMGLARAVTIACWIVAKRNQSQTRRLSGRGIVSLGSRKNWHNRSGIVGLHWEGGNLKIAGPSAPALSIRSTSVRREMGSGRHFVTGQRDHGQQRFPLL